MITGIRIICSIALLFCPVFSPAFYALYITAGVSDMIDGAVARKTGTVSEFGSKLDTAADFVLVVNEQGGGDTAFCAAADINVYDLKYSGVFVSAVATFAAIQEGHLIRIGAIQEGHLIRTGEVIRDEHNSKSVL